MRRGRALNKVPGRQEDPLRITDGQGDVVKLTADEMREAFRKETWLTIVDGVALGTSEHREFSQLAAAEATAYIEARRGRSADLIPGWRGKTGTGL
jgi:hypothetical protein